jgi:hypothetical protein
VKPWSSGSPHRLQLEDAGIFEFAGARGDEGGDGLLFFSRRIGLVGGNRLAPGKNLAVGRVKANFGSQSYLGALFTNGDPTGRTSNQVGGVDLKLATSNFLER